MTEPVLPGFYESVSEERIYAEAGEPVIHPQDYNTDILPFPSLGGRRFEILTYFLLRSDPRYKDACITLVKTSGDEGRDLLVHRNGQLATVIQCKNLEKRLDKSALMRELVKFALHQYRAAFVNDSVLEYQIWATGGFTAPADNLIATWTSDAWVGDDLRRAFNSVAKGYKAFSGLSWEDCREQLEQHFPNKVRITKLNGLDLTVRLRQEASVFNRFFTANIVMKESDVEKSLGEILKKEGLRHVTDVDIRLILDALEAFPSESRHYIGSFVLGLTPQHYALMTHEELRDFSLNCLRATSINVSLLIGAITRHALERLQIATGSMKFGSASFRYVLQQVITDRILQRSSVLAMPSLLQDSSLFSEIKNLSLGELIEQRIVRVWDDYQLARQQYDSDKHPIESDSWFRARFAYHALLGIEIRDQLESALRSDFQLNIDAICVLDKELQALVPSRFMVVGDTRTAFEDKNLMDQLIKSLQDLDKAWANSQENTNEHKGQSKGKPQLERVTWAKLPYKDEAYFRGCEGGLVFRGYNFSDELEITYRHIGGTIPAGHNDYFWQKPNILLPNYAELSTGGDELESPLSYYGREFCVRNSFSDTSEWVAFDYPFDWKRLNAELDQCEERGRNLYASGCFAEAIEPLRRAMVFADCMLGESSERTISLTEIWNEALNSATLAKLRFRQGARVKLIGGQHTGRQGVVADLMLRCVQAYQIRLDDEDEAVIFASDDEVEEVEGSDWRD